MPSRPLQLVFSYSAADDRLPIGSGARFGFLSMVRLNLALSLARRGIVVGARDPKPAAAADAEPGHSPFATLLRRHRIAAGLSQDALAERARISLNGLGALERGSRRNPQRETLLLLMQALALGADDRAAFEAAAKREPKTAGPSGSGAGTSLDAASADVMIVALTPAWVADESCREQLSRFVECETPSDGEKRIFVIRRDPYVPAAPVDGLRDRPFFDFFRFAHALRSHEPLYRNDGTPDAAFYDVVDALAEGICAPWRFDSASPRSMRACIYGILHHSDRGSQYAGRAYRQLLRDHGIRCSMSRKGDCWDNAVVERFNATIKTELIHRAKWATREAARTAI